MSETEKTKAGGRLIPIKRPPDILATVAVRAAIAHLLESGHGRSARAIWLHGASLESETVSAIVARAVNVTVAHQAAQSMLCRERGNLRGDVARQVLRELAKDAECALTALRLSRWWQQDCGHPVTDYDGTECGWGCNEQA